MSTDDVLYERSIGGDGHRVAPDGSGGCLIRLLGPLEVESDGVVAELGPPKQRALLALLALSPNEVVSTDRLILHLWGERAPRTARHSIQIYVSELRKAFAALTTAPAIATRSPGYRLEVPPDAIDAPRFEQLVGLGRRAARNGDVAGASAALRAALELWRGPALFEFMYEDFAQPHVRRLQALRLDTIDELAGVEVESQQYKDAIALTEAVLEEEPLRENSIELLMLALYRSGRHVDALRVYEAHRRLLAEQLGVIPSPLLRKLHERILLHDESLGLKTTEVRPLRHREPNPDEDLRPFPEPAAPDFLGDALVENLLPVTPRKTDAAVVRPAERGGVRRARRRLVGLSVAILAVFVGATMVIVAQDGAESIGKVALFYSPGGEIGDVISDAFDGGVSDFGLLARKIDGDTQALDAAAAGQDLVIVFKIDEDVESVASAHPDTRFVVLDRPSAAANVTSIEFADQEGAYLVGAAAALQSTTGTIGFVGGVEVDVIWSFQAGFEAGARAIDPSIEILTTYLSRPPDYGEGFLNPDAGEAAARQLYAAGADVIFAAAGTSGLGVFEAAVELSTPEHWLWAIGVDSDQYTSVVELPGSVGAVAWREHILTSMVKRLDVAVHTTLADFADGSLDGTPRILGLAEGGVDISYSGGFLRGFGGQIEALRRRIVTGDIQVPCRPADRPPVYCE